MSKKKVITQANQDLIKANLGAMSTESMATVTGIPHKQILEIVARLQESEANPDTAAVTQLLIDDRLIRPAVKELRESSTWNHIKSQFDASERKFFENQYCELIEQLGADVVATERLQVYQLITHMILGQRSLIRSRMENDNLDRIEKELNSLYTTYNDPSTREPRVVNTISALEGQRNQSLNRIESSQQVYGDVDKRSQAILVALKGTREQRIKNLQERGGTWSDMLREVINIEQRLKMDRENAMLKRATERVQEQFEEPHNFPDGTNDPLLLAPPLS